MGSKKADLKDKFRSKFFEIGYVSPSTPVSFIESSFLDLTRQACYPRSMQQLITMDLVSSGGVFEEVIGRSRDRLLESLRAFFSEYVCSFLNNIFIHSKNPRFEVYHLH